MKKHLQFIALFPFFMALLAADGNAINQQNNLVPACFCSLEQCASDTDLEDSDHHLIQANMLPEQVLSTELNLLLGQESNSFLISLFDIRAPPQIVL